MSLEAALEEERLELLNATRGRNTAKRSDSLSTTNSSFSGPSSRRTSVVHSLVPHTTSSMLSSHSLRPDSPSRGRSVSPHSSLSPALSNVRSISPFPEGLISHKERINGIPVDEIPEEYLTQERARQLSSVRSSDEPSNFSIIRFDPLSRLEVEGGMSRRDSFDDDNLELPDESSDEEEVSESDSDGEYDGLGSVAPNFVVDDLQVAMFDRRNGKDGGASGSKLLEPKSLLNPGDDSTKEKHKASPISYKAMLAGPDSKHDRYYRDNRRELLGTAKNSDYDVPDTDDPEVKEEEREALELNRFIEISEVESDRENNASIRTITRGDKFFDALDKEVVSFGEAPKEYLCCVDLSSESLYALEWCVGSLLTDLSVLYVVNAIEVDENKKTGSAALLYNTPKTPEGMENQRQENIRYMTNEVLKYIKRTKLRVHVVVESIHHPMARHLISELIDNIKPTVVVVGSKGRKSVNSAFLGQMTNYLITKSSIPVMVVKHKLKRVNKKKLEKHDKKNYNTLAMARID